MKKLDLDGLQELLWSFAGQRAVTTASGVGILHLLADETLSAPEVASRLELDPTATRKVLRALDALGILEHRSGKYWVAAALAETFRSGPGDLGPFIAHSHHLYESWGDNLEPWLRGGEWTRRPRDREGIHQFGQAMRAMGSRVAPQLASHLSLEGAQRVLDVGGGFGHYSAALCEKSPELRATVLDTPEVAELAQAELAGSELEQRIEFRGGDYHLTDYGTGYDLVLLVNVLHQELADPAADMVRRAARATRPGGRVVVLDFSLDGAESPLGALFAINMRSFGDTWDEATLRSWMEEAGLTRVERIDISSYRWLIIGHR